MKLLGKVNYSICWKEISHMYSNSYCANAHCYYVNNETFVSFQIFSPIIKKLKGENSSKLSIQEHYQTDNPIGQRYKRGRLSVIKKYQSRNSNQKPGVRNWNKSYRGIFFPSLFSMACSLRTTVLGGGTAQGALGFLQWLLVKKMPPQIWLYRHSEWDNFFSWGYLFEVTLVCI